MWHAHLSYAYQQVISRNTHSDERTAFDTVAPFRNGRTKTAEAK